MDFAGRDRELRILENLHQRRGAQFLILYGRRRIGKTRLLQQWTANNLPSGRFLYWMATQTSTTNQLRSFSQAIIRHSNPQALVAPTFSYESWETAFAEVARLAREERFVVILDEFTYVMQANSEVPSIIQKVWDHQLKTSNLFLILTGSLAGIIQRSALDYQAPLYGRATARLKLQPLSFGALPLLLPDMTSERRVAVYAVTGGIPAYVELFDDELNILQNLEQNIISTGNVMLEDAVFLLREQLNQPRNYMALLEAIAAGYHTMSDIAKMAGLERSNANKYLTVLQELGYVERQVPVTVRRPEQSRKGRFVITDAYLRFYFRFLRPYMSEIEYGRIRPALNLLRDQLTSFIGTHTFEELSRDWVHIKADLDELPFLPDRVGSHWARDAQVDVAAINWRTKQILLGECKWGRQPVKSRVIDTLIGKTNKVLPAKTGWQCYYAFFTRSPLTAEARQQVQQAQALQIDLAQMEQDMLRWLQQS